MMMKDYMKLQQGFIMKNIVIDINIILDSYIKERKEKFPESVKAFDYLKNKDFAFISSSSLDNIEFLLYDNLSITYKNKTKKEKLKVIHLLFKELLSFFKIAKTPSYIEMDFNDIEDSLIIASARAIDGLVLTRDENMIKKYPNDTISPKEFLEKIKSKEIKIDFANLKKQHFKYYSEIEKSVDKVYNHSRFIMGAEINKLEENLSAFSGAKNSITCSSGTDALLLAMMAFDIKEGDEIITTPFTFIATAETIALLGAKPSLIVFMVVLSFKEEHLLLVLT
jgi:hypothetical protein